MINNITSLDMRPQMAVAKAMPSVSSMSMPPILGFKTPQLKEKAILKVKKIKRSDNIAMLGDIEDDYVDIVDEVTKEVGIDPRNFFASPSIVSQPVTRRVKYLKHCYIIDFIQSPKVRCGLGTAAIKSLAEKAMFDTKAQGRIVTFSSPMVRESSPAIFFYKLGFRFTSPEANQYIEDCIAKNIPDIPPQTGMMYLPKNYLNKLLRYGELF